MKIIFPEKIEEFACAHSDAGEALERWCKKIGKATWQQHKDLKTHAEYDKIKDIKRI